MSDASSNVTVAFTVRNVGEHKGDEVAQLYISDIGSSVVAYVMRLRGFERFTLEPGESKKVEFTLGPRHLELFDENMRQVVEPGLFKVYVGSSSEDIRLRGEFTVK